MQDAAGKCYPNVHLRNSNRLQHRLPVCYPLLPGVRPLSCFLQDMLQWHRSRDVKSAPQHSGNDLGVRQG